MPYRVRTRKGLEQQPGTLYQILPNGERYAIARGSDDPFDLQYMSDSIQSAPFDTPQNLHSKRASVHPFRINGKYSTGGVTYECVNYNPANVSGAQYAPKYSSGDPDINEHYWITKALAGMNINVPDVDIPLFIFEMKDFPRMYQQLGKVARAAKGFAKDQAAKEYLAEFSLKDYPDGILSTNFGWKPLLSDMSTLANLIDEISDRGQHRKRLEEGYRFARSLGSNKHSGLGGLYTFGNTVWPVTNSVKEKVWFTAFAEIQSDPFAGLPRSPGFALREALGLNVSAATIWNAIPWSWLADYFSNVGDILNARRGKTQIAYREFCLMAEKSFTKSIGRKIIGPLDASGGILTTTFKTRRVVYNPTPMLASKPALTGGQMSNIGALVASKLIMSSAS